MSSLLRICTAGSVDDGKSTLIGRLLYDSQAVYEDQTRAVERASRNRTAGPIDFSLFTDGLKAEREQGITIDVAYRYFATSRRKFILADTPGHEQYTRNMATGASTSDVAILLVDARHGICVQTERHARIARLLGITVFILAVNKMDLVGFDRGVFEDIRERFETLLRRAHGMRAGRARARRAGGEGETVAVQAIPVSALHGDNVTAPSNRMRWYDGPVLLEYLETVDVEGDMTRKPFRFPVQLVLRPDQEFRGYAGQIVSGKIRPGDAVTLWPAGHATRVARIVTWDGDLDRAFAPMSVTLVLEDHVDVSRGDLIARGEVDLTPRFNAQIVWMDERPMDPSRVYLLKQGTRTVTAEVDRRLSLNEIGNVTVTASRPLVFDRYAENRGTGSFILIDAATNFTAGAGMITAAVPQKTTSTGHAGMAERLAVLARTAPSQADAADAVRRALEEMLT
jgi:sulfate adenylyltransferase large subunit